MNIALWPRDSIARRFALTVALAVAVTWSLVGLFFVFGGVWAQPSLERSGLLDRAADMVRIIEAAPPPIREQLASAATTRAFRVDWYAATSPVSTVLEQATSEAPEHIHAVMEKLLGERRLVVNQPRNFGEFRFIRRAFKKLHNGMIHVQLKHRF